MRRGINIRKKKKIISNKLNKNALKLLALLLIIFIICILFYCFVFKNFFIQKQLEQESMSFGDLNKNIPFSLNKIILFSSVTAKSDSINQQLSLDISQYTDIGIYLNPSEYTNAFISSLYIDNISVSSTELGTPHIYSKSLSDLGKCSFNKDNIINDRFDFNLITPENSINYSNYEIYSNGTTPIALGFYNENIKTEFMPNQSEVSYNGTLLKEANIPLVSLYCNISFTLNIITNSSEHYICNMNFDIPFEDSNGSIYDTGYVTKELTGQEINKFIRIK